VVGSADAAWGAVPVDRSGRVGQTDRFGGRV